MIGLSPIHTRAISQQQLQIDQLQRRLSDPTPRAADNPAQVPVRSRVESELRGLGVASSNLQDGLSLLNQLDDGLNSLRDVLLDVRDLALSAASSTSDGQAEQTELEQVRERVGDLADQTSFGRPLFDDYSEGRSIQAGHGAGDTIEIAGDLRLGEGSVLLGDVEVEVGEDTVTVSLDDLDLTTEEGAQTAIAAVDALLDRVDAEHVAVGASTRAVERRLDSVASSEVSLQERHARLSGPDVAQTMLELTQTQMRQQASVALMAQDRLHAGRVHQLIFNA